MSNSQRQSNTERPGESHTLAGFHVYFLATALLLRPLHVSPLSRRCLIIGSTFVEKSLRPTIYR